MGWFNTKDAPDPPGGTITTWIKRRHTAKGVSGTYTVEGEEKNVTIDNGSHSVYCGNVYIRREDLPLIIAMLQRELETAP